MVTWFEIFDKLLHPHRKKQEKLMSRMIEYRELSSIALENENQGMYSLLQRELNEMFCEYLTWSFLDGIGFLIPHVLIMGLISIWWPYFALPFKLPVIDNHAYVIVWYPLIIIIYYVGHRLLRRNTGSMFKLT
ncbi:hypothetical protein DEAC_c23820 [Desulfosporosinus acididurans]|uniref:Uncharacterized protein n=1 Tax=Desulfosporosinus acididurans TaxID=476652 RepID=A0A0J1FR29_9FIRM|nr:hypothetical protein DEAC_c23820 [Desulfosporosinus acididurans]